MLNRIVNVINHLAHYAYLVTLAGGDDVRQDAHTRHQGDRGAGWQPGNPALLPGLRAKIGL